MQKIANYTDSIKRSVYLIGLPAAMLAVLLLIFAEWRQGTLHVVDAVGLPLLALLFGVLTLSLWREVISLTRLEAGVFTGTALMYLVSLGYSVFGLSPVEAAFWNLAGLGYWSPVVYTLAFLVFGVRLGLRVSFAVYLLSMLVWLVHFATLHLAGEPPMGEAVFYQLFASGGLLLILLYGSGRAFAVQARQAARLEQDANTDPLTRLHNRRYLVERMDQEAARLSRQPHPSSVILVDLDHFKEVNDLYGHGMGDKVLQEVGATLLRHARKMDVVGRWGGEEFLILLPDTALAEALEVAGRLRSVLEHRQTDGVGTVTASFGVAQYKTGEPVKELVERADRALYRAKGAGRNRVGADHDEPGDRTMHRPEITRLT